LAFAGAEEYPPSPSVLAWPRARPIRSIAGLIGDDAGTLLVLPKKVAALRALRSRAHASTDLSLIEVADRGAPYWLLVTDLLRMP
jgi:hypothetical protein